MITLVLELLLLIVAANAAPILANHFASRLPKTAIDAGWLFVDGHPLFGESKTWRGLICAISLSLLVAALLDLPLALGAGMGLLAMCGDLISSFIKRRLGMASSAKAMLLDQIPESLLPALLAVFWLNLPLGIVLWVVFLFIIFELVISPLAYWLRIRKRPY